MEAASDVDILAVVGSSSLQNAASDATEAERAIHVAELNAKGCHAKAQGGIEASQGSNDTVWQAEAESAAHAADIAACEAHEYHQKLLCGVRALHTQLVSEALTDKAKSTLRTFRAACCDARDALEQTAEAERRYGSSRAASARDRRVARADEWAASVSVSVSAST